MYPPDDCADFIETKEKYGKTTCLVGCVPPVMAVTGTDEEWDDYCKKMIDEMGKDGGFVLATGCEYPANAGFERAKRMVDIAKGYGSYT
jgi:uroporphyrinogen decarboxylase